MVNVIKKDQLLSLIPFCRTINEPDKDYERGYKDCLEEAIRTIQCAHAYEVNEEELSHIAWHTALTPMMTLEMKDRPVYLVDIADPSNNGWGIVTIDRYNILVNGKTLTNSQYLFYNVPTQEEIQASISHKDF